MFLCADTTKNTHNLFSSININLVLSSVIVGIKLLRRAELFCAVLDTNLKTLIYNCETTDIYINVVASGLSY